VERRIQEAQEGGQFEDLPGRGKPLDLRENPFVKHEWRLAYRVLKSAGFAPDWIELEDRLLWANEVLSSKADKDEVDAELDDMYRWTIARYTEQAN